MELIQSGKVAPSKIAIIVPLGIGSLAVPVALVFEQMKYNMDLFVAEPLSHCKFLSEYINLIPNGHHTLADGAAVNEVPLISNEILKKVIYGTLGITEEEIKKGIHYLWSNLKIKSEGAGALSIAAYLSNPEMFVEYDQVWTFVTGNNIEDAVFEEVISKFS